MTMTLPNLQMHAEHYRNSIEKKKKQRNILLSIYKNWSDNLTDSMAVPDFDGMNKAQKSYALFENCAAGSSWNSQIEHLNLISELIKELQVSTNKLEMGLQDTNAKIARERVLNG